MMLRLCLNFGYPLANSLNKRYLGFISVRFSQLKLQYRIFLAAYTAKAAKPLIFAVFTPSPQL